MAADKNKALKTNDNTTRHEFDIIRGARRGDLNEVENAVVENPSCINRQEETNGLTALHFAASNGDMTLVDYLCDTDNVIVNMPDNEGRTAAHLAWLICRNDIKMRINRDIYERLKKKLVVDELGDGADNVMAFRSKSDPDL